MAAIRPDHHQGRVQLRPDCDHSWKATRGATIPADLPGHTPGAPRPGPATPAYMKALGGSPSRLVMGSSFSSLSMKKCDCTAVQTLLVSQ